MLLKCCICSLPPHTNLCSCHSCYTHQPCYQPNHTGSIWLRRKARSPGESVPVLLWHALWLWNVLQGRPLCSMCSHQVMRRVLRAGVKGKGGQRWRKRGKVESGFAAVFWGPVPTARISLKSQFKIWITHYVRRMTSPIGFIVLVSQADFSITNKIFPIIPWKRSSEVIKIIWIYFN